MQINITESKKLNVTVTGRIKYASERQNIRHYLRKELIGKKVSIHFGQKPPKVGTRCTYKLPGIPIRDWTVEKISPGEITLTAEGRADFIGIYLYRYKFVIA